VIQDGESSGSSPAHLLVR